MASGDHRAAMPDIDGSGLRTAIIRTRWNETIVDRLADGARRSLEALGVSAIDEVFGAEAAEAALEVAMIARRYRSA